MPPVPTVIPDGAAIRRFRLQRGWTCRDVASKIGGRHARTISRMEKSSDPVSIVLAVQVANALGVQPSRIILGDVPEVLREPASGDGSAA